MLHRSTLFSLLALAFVSACAAEGPASTSKRELSPPDVLDGDTAADAFSRRLDYQGVITYGASVSASYSATGYAGWSFVGKAGARVSLDLVGDGNDPVLYLYGPKRGDSWSYVRRIATNDDFRGLDSHIDMTLRHDGTYLVLAREYWGDAGSFTLSLACEGDECRPECGDEDRCPAGSACQRIYCITTPCPSYCEAVDPVVACGSDDDCAIAQTTCCPCSMGGRQRAVNADYADAVTPECGDEPIACPAVFLCRPERAACVANRCELVPTLPTECTPDECGPRPLLPTVLCDDGETTAGAGPCERQADGSCGWTITTCPEPRACGSRGLAPCNEGEYCRFDLEDICGATDRPGVCETIPNICTREVRPVCGCDGETYTNACNAAARGISVASEGPCEVPSDCRRAGCSGELCVGPDEPGVSICLWRPVYACYDGATCERQADGRCGFTPTAELTACIDSHR